MAESRETGNYHKRLVHHSGPSRTRHDVKSSNGGQQNVHGNNSRSHNPRVCRYFLRGRCTRSECRFMHEMPGNARNNTPQVISDYASSKTTTMNPLRNGDRSIIVSSLNMPSTSTQSSSDILDTDDQEQNGTEGAYGYDPFAKLSSSGNISGKKSRKNEKDQAAAVLEAQKTSREQSSLQTDWANAPEFVPSQPKLKSYAQAVNPIDSEQYIAQVFCQFTTKDGFCGHPTGQCNKLHYEVCDLCCRAVMDPSNDEQRKQHRQECIQQHERDMELSFALARSKGKTCAVCLEVIMEKENVGEQRFGILPNCNHCFCLTCIRRWRQQVRHFENKLIRGCPECRVTSDFVCPSAFWVDTQEEKDKLIDDYKKALATKNCKYFKRGSGKCPFGNKCFYLHAFPDGRVCDVGPPRQRRRRTSDRGPYYDVLQHVILWDFLEERANPWQTLADDLEDFISFFSDTDDDTDEFSDYDFIYE